MKLKNPKYVDPVAAELTTLEAEFVKVMGGKTEKTYTVAEVVAAMPEAMRPKLTAAVVDCIARRSGWTVEQ